MLRKQILNKVFLIAIITFLTNTSYAQDTSSLTTAIELPKMNILYYNRDNPLKIVVDGCPHSEIQVLVNNGKISGENGDYIYRPEKKDTAVLTVLCGEKVVRTSKYRIKYSSSGEPVLQMDSVGFDYRKGGIITKQALMNAQGVMIASVGSDYDHDFNSSFKIEQFTVFVKSENGDVELESVSYSNKLTQEQRSVIDKISEGKVYFENIMTKGPDGTVRDLGVLNFYLIGR